MFEDSLVFLRHLSPVFEKVFPEDVLGGVIVLQHFRKEGSRFLSVSTELHWLAFGGRENKEIQFKK